MARREQQEPHREVDAAKPVNLPLFNPYAEIKTPPMGSEARKAAGYYLRKVQSGEVLSMPASRPMPEIAAGCHELRIDDHEANVKWRVVYFIDDIAIVILAIFEKKTRATPNPVKDICRERRTRYLNAKGSR